MTKNPSLPDSNWTPRTGAMARLLGLHRPLPQRTPAQLEAEARHNYRWNFWVNLVDGASFRVGASFVSASTILPLFLTKLTDSPLPVGLLAVIAQGGWFLPQLFSANLVEQLPSKKAVVANLGLFLERLPYWLLALTPLLALRAPSLTVALTLLTYSWLTVGAGLIATSWQALIGRVFPVERRGRFMGVSSFIGTGGGALGALLSAHIVEVATFPTNFFYLFLIGASFIMVSWIFLSLTREPVAPVTVAGRSQAEFFSRLPVILRHDHNFRRYLIARSLLALGALGGGFLTVAALKRWNIPDGTVGQYTLALLVGEALGNLFLGMAADRFGHKRNLVIGSAGAVLSFVLAALAPRPTWFFLVFALQGVAGAGIFVSGIVLVLEFCQPEQVPTYSGLANTIVGISAVLAPLVGTALAALDYTLLFAVSAGVNLIALALMAWWVQEPRWTAQISSPL